MKVNFNKLALANDEDTFVAAIASIKRRGETVQMDIHRFLCAILERWTITGDVRPMVKYVNLLLAELPKGVRSNAIKAWVEVHMGLIWAVDGENKNTFVAGKRKAKDVQLKDAQNERWFEFKAEPDYKPMDFDKMFAALMSRAAKADPEKGDAVDKGLLEALNKAAHEYKQSKIDF